MDPRQRGTAQLDLEAASHYLTFMPIKPITPSVKEYLRSIGSKGGKKSAQHPDRKRLNSEAAIARWRGRIPKIKEPIPK